MKAKINDIEVECSVEEFFQLNSLLDKRVKAKTLAEGMAGVSVVAMATSNKVTKHQHRKSSCARWTAEELEIVKANPPRKAHRLLKHRSMESIFSMRSKIGVSTMKRIKTDKRTSPYKVNSDRLKKVHADSKVLAQQLGISPSKAYAMLIKVKGD